MHRRSLVATTILLLNLMVALGVNWEWYHLFFSAGLFTSILPIIGFLESPQKKLPIFPVISLIYGVFFCLFGIIPFDPYYTTAGVSHKALLLASILSWLGIVCMQVGYRLGSTSADRANRTKHEVLINSAGSRAVIIGLVGMVGWVANFLVRIPNFQSVFTTISELLIFAFLVLLYLQLNNRISRAYFLINWFVFFVTIIFTSLATSQIGPIVRLLLLTFVVFIYVKKAIPWRILALASLILIPVFFLKIGYRALQPASNKWEFSGVGQMAQRVETYGGIAKNIVTNMDMQVVKQAYNTTANRFDLTRTFALIIDSTPSQIPYFYGESYRDLLWKPIPRVLYPSKPVENWGNELGHRFGMLAPNDDDTSVNLPQMIELYINFGPTGVFLGMLAIGAIYAGLIRVLYRNHNSIQGLITIFVLSSLFNVESNFSLVFGGLIYSIPFFIVLIKMIHISKLEQYTSHTDRS